MQKKDPNGVHSLESQIVFEIEHNPSGKSIFPSPDEIVPNVVFIGTDASPDELEQLVKALPSRFVGNLLNAIGSVMENR